MRPNVFRIVFILVVVAAVALVGVAAWWFFVRNGGRTPTTREVDKVTKTLNDVTTVHFVATNTDTKGNDILKCEGDIVRPLRLHYTCTRPGTSGATEQNEYIQIGSSIYRHDSFAWVQEINGAGSTIDTFYPLPLLDLFYSRLTLAVLREEQGQTTYQFDATPQDVAGARTALAALFTGELTQEDRLRGQIVIDDQHRLTSEKVQIIHQDKPSELFTLHLSKFNSDITVADPSPVITDPSETATEKEPTTLEEKNARRLSDMRKITVALAKYYADHGKYPESTTLAKLSGSESAVVQALVPTYLSTMPLDPEPQTYYYGYQSLGQQYTLTTAIVAADGSYQIYVVTDN